jgi:hypothetical protein
MKIESIFPVLELVGRTNDVASLRRGGKKDSRQHDGDRKQKRDQQDSHGANVAPL